MIYSIFKVCVVLMFHRATVQYSPVLHVIRMCSSDHAHSDHERQLAKIMAKVGLVKIHPCTRAICIIYNI